LWTTPSVCWSFCYPVPSHWESTKRFQAVVTDHDDFYTENSQSDVELGNIDMPNAENLEQDIIGNLIKGTLPI
jgi:hypothetical protein